jgi:protein SCO1/2
MASAHCEWLSPALLVAAAFASTADAQTTLPPDESKTLGQRVAEARFLDENGRTLEVRLLEGKPLLVSPIFAKCPHACPMITKSLKEAVAGVGAAGEDFNVLSITFDVSDTQEDLKAYREKMGLPQGWMLARAESEELLPFLESIDFRFISNADGSFTHPNLVVALTPELRVAKYLYGIAYEADDLRAALAVARGEDAVLNALAPYIFLVAVLGATISGLIVLITLKRSRAQAGGAA